MTRVLRDYKIKKVMTFFCEDITASKTAALTGIKRDTINRHFNLFRVKIAAFPPGKGRVFSGEIELDESYFGARRVRGKRERGAAGKTPVFGGFKRGGNVRRLRWSRIAQKISLFLSFKAKSWKDPQSTLMGGKLTTGSFEMAMIITAFSTLQMNLPGAKITLTASNLSGLLRNDA